MVIAAVGGVAAAGALGVGGGVARWWDRAPSAGMKALSGDEYAFAQAMAEAWFPSGGEPALSGAEAHLGGFLDEVVAAMEPATAREMKLLLQVLDDLTLPTHLAPFRALPLEARIETLRGWLHADPAPLRSAVQAVMALLSVGWTTHPQVAARLQPLFGCGYGR